jgi:hypothetical protein
MYNTSTAQGTSLTKGGPRKDNAIVYTSRFMCALTCITTPTGDKSDGGNKYAHNKYFRINVDVNVDYVFQNGVPRNEKIRTLVKISLFRRPDPEDAIVDSTF